MQRCSYFYPRSPCGERPFLSGSIKFCNVFLSTLSLRRATTGTTSAKKRRWISIHALLAESDAYRVQLGSMVSISIHALLAESDPCDTLLIYCHLYFYPRSPCGERHRSYNLCSYDPRFLSTLSLRRATVISFLLKPSPTFLSTLSLRRATNIGWAVMVPRTISIHALLAESDRRRLW